MSYIESDGPRRGVREFTAKALICLLRLPDDTIITGCSWNIETESFMVGYRSEDFENTAKVWDGSLVSSNQGGGQMGVITKIQIDDGDYPRKKVTDDAGI